MSYLVNSTKFYKQIFLLLALFFWFNVLVSGVSAIEYGCLKTDRSCESIDIAGFSTAAADCVARFGPGTRPMLEGCNNFGCISPSGACTPITAVDRVEGQEICDAMNAQYGGQSVNSEPGTFLGGTVAQGFSALPCDRRVTDWGCVKPDGTCVNIRNADPSAASRECERTYGTDSYVQLDACGPEKGYVCIKGEESDCVLVRANTTQGASRVCKERCLGTNITCYVDFGRQECPPAVLGELEKLQQSANSNLNRAGISNPTILIRRFINLLMAFIGSITLVLYVYAGVLWLIARGESENIEKAKKIMVWTTLGVTVMLFSYILVSFVFGIIPK